MRLALSLTLTATIAHAESATQLLERADTLGFERANWQLAGPLYRQAQTQLNNDPEHQLQAEIGILRADMEHSSIAIAADRCADLLKFPNLSEDNRFRLLRVQGDAYKNLDPGLAETTWTAVRDLARRRNNPIWENRAKGEIALANALQGNIGAFTSAIGDVIRQAELLADKVAQSRWLAILGQGYVRFGRTEEALKLCERANAAMAGAPDGVKENMLATVCIAQTQAILKRPEALQTMLDAECRATAAGAVGFQAQWKQERAALLERQGDVPGAIQLLQESERLARQVNAVRLLSEALTSLARLQMRAGDLRGTEEVYRRGIQIARESQDRMNLPRMLAGLAHVVHQQGRQPERVAVLEEAADIADAMLSTLSSPWLRQRLLEANRDVFGAFVDAELESEQPDLKRLFRAVERTRGRAFQDVVRVPDVEPSPEIVRIQKRLWTAKTREARQQIIQELLDAEVRNTTVEWRSAPVRMAEMAAVQHRLAADESLVEFILGKQHAAALVFEKERIRLVRLGPRSAVEATVSTWLDAIQKDLPTWRKPAHAAALAIWTPLELRTERGVIVPDGLLHGAPFEALEAAGKLVLDTNILTYAPSATSWARIEPKRITAPNVLAVSASRRMPLSSAATGVKRGEIDVDLSKLPPLPAADAEARAVLSAFRGQGTLLTGATEATFKTSDIASRTILHLALHGVANARNPNRAALVFLLDASQEDGLLQAHEIVGLRLNASIVTLAACDSGGGAAGQEGVASLVRPLLGHASVTSVVASLWPVDDNVSLRLMTSLYKSLAVGRDIGVSLADAKRDLLRSVLTMPPKLWSGVLVYGSGTSAATAATSTNSP